MDTGIRFMLINLKIDHLSQVFELFSFDTETYKSITEELIPYIKERGEELFNNKDISIETISKY